MIKGVKNLGFHESTVASFDLHDKDFSILLEKVKSGGKDVNAIVSILEVSSIIIDNKPEQELVMGTSDGEILTLELYEKELYMLIEWRDFPTRQNWTKSYRIIGNKVTCSINS